MFRYLVAALFLAGLQGASAQCFYYSPTDSFIAANIDTSLEIKDSALARSYLARVFTDEYQEYGEELWKRIRVYRIIRYKQYLYVGYVRREPRWQKRFFLVFNPEQQMWLEHASASELLGLWHQEGFTYPTILSKRYFGYYESMDWVRELGFLRRDPEEPSNRHFSIYAALNADWHNGKKYEESYGSFISYFSEYPDGRIYCEDAGFILQEKRMDHFAITPNREARSSTHYQAGIGKNPVRIDSGFVAKEPRPVDTSLKYLRRPGRDYLWTKKYQLEEAMAYYLPGAGQLFSPSYSAHSLAPLTLITPHEYEDDAGSLRQTLPGKVIAVYEENYGTILHLRCTLSQALGNKLEKWHKFLLDPSILTQQWDFLLINDARMQLENSFTLSYAYPSQPYAISGLWLQTIVMRECAETYSIIEPER